MPSSKERRALQRTQGLPPGDPRHGKNTTYANYGCRCDLCREAQRLFMAGQRIKMRAAGLPDPEDKRHGTTNGYGNYGCRCPRCVKAGAWRRVAPQGNDKPVA